MVRTGEAAFLRVREAALVLGISNSAAYELASAWLASDGRTGLPAVRMGRRILIPRAAIDGLLQICTERTILRRERLVGLRLGAYVASKVAILVPFLLLVVVATLGVLRLLDRLPGRPLSTYASMGISLLLCAVAALGLGLLTSATVRNVAQATLALPMLCFPAVLFSGAILPVNLMARAGAGLSMVIPSRWAFEAIGHDLGARRILAQGGSPLGPPLLASYGHAGTQSTGTYWLILAAFAVVFLVATWVVLVHSTRKSMR